MERCAHRSISSCGSLSQYIGGPALPTLQRTQLQERRIRAPFVINALCFRALDFARRPIFRFESDTFLAEVPYLRKHVEDLDFKEKVDELRAAALRSLPTRNEATDYNPISESQGTIDDQSRSKNDKRGPHVCFIAWTGVAAALFHCGFFLKAIAEESFQKPESAEAAARAPNWLVPAVLAFPVVSYVIFSVYRDQVNPYAKVTDWMFGVAAVVILANLILISTIGVRLY